jgi:hypothetical protein
MSAGAVKAGGVFVEIGADPTKFFAALKGVNKNIGSIGKAMTSAGTKMAAMGAGVVGPIFASAAAFASVGSALFDMSKRTGVATESLSVLQFAAEQTGTDMGGVETALKKMQKAVFAAGSGSKEAAEALAMVGLSASDLEGLSADQQMGKIADGLMAIEDPGARAAVAMKIFGKSGTDILPMLEGGSAGMAAFADEAKRLGLVMDSETAAKADALGDAIDSVKSSMKMAFIQVGSAVAPILTQLAQGLAIVAANVGKFISENQAFVVSVLKGGAALFVVGTAITGIGYSLRGLSGGISLVLKGFGLFSALASPVLLVAAGIGAAVFALYKFKDQIGAALGPVASLVQQAAGAIGEGFGPAVSDGIVVLGDLAKTATTTFNGVYEAVAAGDLSGAMDVLWAGLVAGWLRGTEALMSYVDPWVAAFQDVFTDIGSGIYIAWDKIYTDSAALLNTMGAFIMGFFDNIANGVMATFDNLVAGIQIAWTRVQGFITGAKDTEKRVQDIKDENAARAEQRMQERPGVNARTDKAAAENAQAETQRQDRVKAIMSGAEGDKAARQDENAKRAADRRAGVVAAEAKLGDLTTAKQAERDAAKKTTEQIDPAALASEITSATTMEGLGKAGLKLDGLIAGDKLTTEQEDALLAAYRDVQNGIANADAVKRGSSDSATSKAEVAGTFSSANLGGMGFGSSLAERTAKAAEDTAKGVKELVGQGGGKVAA